MLQKRIYSASVRANISRLLSSTPRQRQKSIDDMKARIEEMELNHDMQKRKIDELEEKIKDLTDMKDSWGISW